MCIRDRQAANKKIFGRDAKIKIKEENSMRINNNLMALNAHRQLSVTTNKAGKAMEKLSSCLLYTSRCV